MIIKLEKILSCSSEHPSYPVANLLKHSSSNSSWRCAKPGEMLTHVIFQLTESSCITGLDIANYRSCVVIVTASTSGEPDNWVPIVNHQFMTHDEAIDGKFKEQIKIFSKQDLNPDTVKIKFDRIKVTCMQSANLKELFGLSFIKFRTEVVVDLGLDVFGRFKLKQDNGSPEDLFGRYRSKYLQTKSDDQKDIANTLSINIRENHKKSDESKSLLNIEENKKNVSPQKQEAHCSKNSPDEIKVSYTAFGDRIPTPKPTSCEKPKKRLFNQKENISQPAKDRKIDGCVECNKTVQNQLCKVCKKLSQPKRDVDKSAKKVPAKPTKPFCKLFENISFSLSGYVNPQRDDIRRKALEMGGRYIADPNTTDKKCTHLICAFKNTPKYRQLKGYSKLVSHKFIEDCSDQKIRFPWRRYALDKDDRDKSESEEEIIASPSQIDPFEVETDEEMDTHH